MSQYTPPGQMAPHIPADAYRRAQATGQPVVFVVNDTPPGFPWRRVIVPFAIAGAVAAGGWGLVAAICFLSTPRPTPSPSSPVPPGPSGLAASR